MQLFKRNEAAQAGAGTMPGAAQLLDVWQPRPSEPGIPVVHACALHGSYRNHGLEDWDCSRTVASASAGLTDFDCAGARCAQGRWIPPKCRRRKSAAYACRSALRRLGRRSGRLVAAPFGVKRAQLSMMFPEAHTCFPRRGCLGRACAVHCASWMRRGGTPRNAGLAAGGSRLAAAVAPGACWCWVVGPAGGEKGGEEGLPLAAS
jgi:hypothetical protein